MLSPEEEQEQRAWFKEHWSHHVPFNVDIGLEITRWDAEVVHGFLPFQARLSAHDGIFHGGVLATALDTIGCGAVVAGHDFNLGNRFTTVSMTVNYLAVTVNQDVTIEATCTKRGKRLNFARSQVVAPDGTVLAEAMLTVSASGQRPRVGTNESLHKPSST